MLEIEFCTHYWICSQPRRGPDKQRITHERCTKCKGERDLIELVSTAKNNKPNTMYYTEIVYPEKEVKDMVRGGNQRKKGKEYKARRDEIIATWIKHDRHFKSTADELGMPVTTLRGLIKKWKVEATDRSHSGETSSSNQISTNNILQKDLPVVNTNSNRPALTNYIQMHEYIEAHADEIIQDINSGKKYIDITNKWGMSDRALRNFKHRHGFIKKKPDIDQNSDLITIFEKVLERNTIEEARMCWIGVKLAKGFESSWGVEDR